MQVRRICGLAAILVLISAMVPASPLLAEPMVTKSTETADYLQQWAQQEIAAAGLPASSLEDRPEWAEQPIALSGSLVWVVAALPATVTDWRERFYRGSKQAENLIYSFIEQTISQRAADSPPDYQERLQLAAKHRTKLHLDREGFMKIEIFERPNVIWLRFGYPAEQLERLLGFPLPGALPLEPPIQPKPAPAVRQTTGSRYFTDYLLEFAWLTGIAAAMAVAIFYANRQKS